jgi:hypothetical protein
MPIQLKEENGGKILVMRVSGTLTKDEYAEMVPEFEQLVRRFGKVNVLFDMSGFDGWDAGAAWEDIKFDVKHFSDIDRLAMVGEKKWQKVMAGLSKPFTTATIRYFDHSEALQARKWLEQEQTARP